MLGVWDEHGGCQRPARVNTLVGKDRAKVRDHRTESEGVVLDQPSELSHRYGAHRTTIGLARTGNCHAGAMLGSLDLDQLPK
jgi:hypothetical protein